ncbi:MAG: hypothetical protein ACJAV3_000444 [Alcanivorax sp.]
MSQPNINEIDHKTAEEQSCPNNKYGHYKTKNRHQRAIKLIPVRQHQVWKRNHRQNKNVFICAQQTTSIHLTFKRTGAHRASVWRA